MRARLLDAGLATIVARGVAGTSIDEIISTAQVSRGTFYKYFDSVTGLAAHLAHDLAREIGLVLDPLVSEQPDPALRMAVGTRMMLHFVRQHPVIGGLTGGGTGPRCLRRRCTDHERHARKLRLGQQRRADLPENGADRHPPRRGRQEHRLRLHQGANSRYRQLDRAWSDGREASHPGEYAVGPERQRGHLEDRRRTLEHDHGE
jgi:AcrR family transcriptional regulator